MSFSAPAALWLALPLLLLFAVSLRRQYAARRALSTLVAESAFRRLTCLGPRGAALHHAGLLLMGLCLVVAAAGPRLGRPSWEGGEGGVVLLLDASISLYAEDVRSAPARGGERPRTRFQQARAFAQDLIDALPGVEIGLVSFSGQAVVHCPPTADHQALREVLDHLSQHTGDHSGSDFTRAFDALLHMAGREGKGFRAVLLGDGELPREIDYAPALRRLAGNGLAVDTVGLGSAAGATVVLYDPEDVRRGARRPTVVARVHTGRRDKVLEEIASATGGCYVPLDRGAWVADLLRAHPFAAAGKPAAPSGDLGPWFFLAFIILFLVETIVLAGRGPRALSPRRAGPAAVSPLAARGGRP